MEGGQRRPSMMESDGPPAELLQDPAARGGAPPNRTRARTNSTAMSEAPGGGPEQAELQNERAITVLNRVKEKLTGRDFKPDEELSCINQVDKLLIEATKLENLCQHYIGWCSFW